MKRFQFQLESVLGYKQQVLDALMIELSERKAAVLRQEQVRAAAHRRLVDYGQEYEERKAEGMTIVEALKYQSCLETLERALEAEEIRLQDLLEKEEEKRREVVAARQENFSLEKLKQIRRKEYDAAVAKEEEKQIDELTIAKWKPAESRSA